MITGTFQLASNTIAPGFSVLCNCCCDQDTGGSTFPAGDRQENIRLRPVPSPIETQVTPEVVETQVTPEVVETQVTPEPIDPIMALESQIDYTKIRAEAREYALRVSRELREEIRAEEAAKEAERKRVAAEKARIEAERLALLAARQDLVDALAMRLMTMREDDLFLEMALAAFSEDECHFHLKL